MGRNTGAREFWEGYRDAMEEILFLGIEAFEAKYSAEFGENDTNDFKGRFHALQECRKRLTAMLKGRG